QRSRDSPRERGPNSTLARTVIHGNNRYCWNMTPRCGLGPSTISPPRLISPVVGRSIPAIMLSSVDFPQPLGPTRATNSPTPTLNDTSCNAMTSSARRVAGKAFWMLLTVNTSAAVGVAAPLGGAPERQSAQVGDLRIGTLELALCRHRAETLPRRLLQR